MTPAWQRWLLIFTSVFAFAWSVFRACVQSITQDEGDTYFWFASQSIRYIWHPFPNNHVLNTLLIWITTRLFGLSPLSLRLPALLGAALFIAACYFLCRSITDRFSLQFPLLICLIYNPFIMDFMVAARGYSLANGFLMAAIAIPVWRQFKGRLSLNASCALVSLAVGLSFAANFYFALVDLVVFLVIATWAITKAREVRQSVIRVIGMLVAPGLFVSITLCAYPLMHWPKDGFAAAFYGAHSLGEMIESLMHVSLYKVYAGFHTLPFVQDISDAKELLPVFLGLLCICQMVAVRRAAKPAAALIGIVALTVLLHWMAFRFYALPLPKARTAIFFFPLCTLAAGLVAAVTPRSELSRWLHQGIAALFVCMAGYYLLCFRFTYFEENEDSADNKKAYAVLAKLNHAYGVTDIAADGIFVAPLNFYRVTSKKEPFPEIPYVPHGALPVGKSAYVLDRAYSADFIKSQNLAVVYRGKMSEVVVAVPAGGPIPATMIEP